MIRFVTALHTRPEMPVKDAANSQLGKRLLTMFTTSKPSSNNQVNEKYF
jgi:hypothetical protein